MARWSILLLVLVAAGISLAEVPAMKTEVTSFDLTCPSNGIGGRFPVSGFCEFFFECRNGNPILFQCNKGFFYDKDRRECRDRRYVKCDDQHHQKPDVGVQGFNFKCPHSWGAYPNPYDCSQFFVCNDYRPILYQCYKNFLFDDKIRRCLPTQKVNLFKRPNKGRDAFLCPSPNGRFPDPKDCSRYYECHFIIYHPKQCPRGQLYDVNKLRCMPERTVDCGKRPGNNFYCRFANDGRFPDPQDCSRYYECRNSIAYHYQCLKNQLYDENKQHCKDKMEVDCGKRPKDPEQKPGTVAPTTTTATPTTSTPFPTTTRSATTTTTPIPTTTTKRPRPTISPTKNPLKPNTPPPTDCHEDDLDCIINATGDVRGWFDCPRRFGHYAHGSSKRLFIHCDNWTPFVKKCTEETEFSSLYHVCVWVDKTKGI